MTVPMSMNGSTPRAKNFAAVINLSIPVIEALGQSAKRENEVFTTYWGVLLRRFAVVLPGAIPSMISSYLRFTGGGRRSGEGMRVGAEEEVGAKAESVVMVVERKEER